MPKNAYPIDIPEEDDESTKTSKLAENSSSTVPKRGRPILSKDGRKQGIHAVIKELDPAKYITGVELRDRVGISRHQFEKLVKRGIILSTARNDKNHALYHVDEVEKVKETLGNRLGVLSRRIGLLGEDKMEYTSHEGLVAMKLFREGKRMDDVFFETAYHPTVLDVIKKDYDAICNALTLPQHILEKIYELPIDGDVPFTTPDDLYQAFKRALQPQRCARCRRRSPAMCMSCARTHRDAVAQGREPINPVPPEGSNEPEIERVFAVVAPKKRRRRRTKEELASEHVRLRMPTEDSSPPPPESET